MKISKKKNITLVFHCDVSQLKLINFPMHVWPGPIAIGVYLNLNQLKQEYLDIIHYYRTNYDRISLSVYSSHDTYPINIVRNRALQLVTTELALILDMDFIPDPGLYNYVMENYEIFSHNGIKIAFVVPAFSFQPPEFVGKDFIWDDNVSLPLSKKDAIWAIKNKTLAYAHWESAQSSTNISNWMITDMIYKVKSEIWYEPYVIVNMKHVPSFDERFIFYGDDKSQWNRHLSFLEYEYWVLPDHFVIHLPHKPRQWSGTERKQNYRLIWKWIRDFRVDLTKMNNAFTRGPAMYFQISLLLFLWYSS